MSDEYIDELAVSISSQLNRPVNKNLATQVVNFAKKFKDSTGFVRACQAFGKFDIDFLNQVYNRVNAGASIKNEFVDLQSANKLEASEQAGGLILPVKREVQNDQKSKYGLDKLAKKIKLEDGVKEELDENDYHDEFKRTTYDNKDKKVSFRKLGGKSQQVKKLRIEDDDKLGTLSQGAREKLEAIRMKRNDSAGSSQSFQSQSRHISRDNYQRQDRYTARRVDDFGREIRESKNNQRNTTNNDRRDKYQNGYERDDRSSSKYSKAGNSNFRNNTLPGSIPEDDIFSDENEDELDRDWYLGEEFGHVAGDESHNPFSSYNEEEEQVLQQKVTKRISNITRQKQKETDLWEQKQMQTSGVGQSSYHDTNFNDEEEENKVQVVVHHLTPPFLDGHQVFTRQKGPISAVKDPNSDMAIFAKRGSALVRERRLKRERQKQARDAASMAGTTLGNVLGVKDTNEDDEPDDGKGETKFAKHIKEESGASEFSKTRTIKQQRQFLPAFAVREDLLKVIRDNQVIIVIGETGSGKTTQLTQYLYEEGYGKRGMIGCTQPRRVAAMSVAKRVSEEMEVKLGDEVGYSIRFEDCTSSKTVIKYMTDGILLRESLMDPALEKYSCIIMDEAHERALNTDVLMGLFKNVLMRRRDIKLIVTSATMNADRFSSFYGGAPQFTIPGRTFPVDVIHQSSPVEDYVDAAVKQVITIHLQSGPGDILVFMTGQEDIEATCEIIAERMELLDKPAPLEILPIYSQMPADLQAKIFRSAKKGTRKVIVATNIAETSLTVDGISYVVDSGYSKMKVYNPRMGMDMLQAAPISVANANQRSGRAGRTGKGVAYRLYTERAEIDEMYKQTIPEIQRTNLANTLLLLKSLGVDNLLEFNFMDPPPMETMTASLYDLWALGALDNFGKLTGLGEKMAKFPMEPSLSKLLIVSLEYGCTEEMLTIVSMLSVPSVFYRPKERMDEADAMREKFFVGESDHLTLLHVYNQWRNNKFSNAWCARHFLHSKSLKRAKEVREQLAFIIQQDRTAHPRSCGTDWDIVRKCICSGYFFQAARVRGLTEYINMRTSVTMQLHPTSALYGLGYLPQYVVYHELILTSREFMSVVTAVDPNWLIEFGSVFYGLRDGHEKSRMEERIERDRTRLVELEEQKKEKKPKQSAVILPGRRKFKSGRRGV